MAQPLSDGVRLAACPPARIFILRLVSEPVAFTAAKMSPAIENAASVMARRTAKPLPPPTELGRRFNDRHELIDFGPLSAVAALPVDESDAAVMASDAD